MREEKSNKREKNHSEGGGREYSFSGEWNSASPQLSFITVHVCVAILATEPNEPSFEHYWKQDAKVAVRKRVTLLDII